MSDSVRVKPRLGVMDDLERVAAAREPQPGKDNDDAGADGPDRSDPLPRPGFPYKAHSRRMAKPQMSLLFVQRDYLPSGFAYANFERVWMVNGDKPGSGPLLMIRFAGSVVTEVTIEGRHLFTLCNAVASHLIPWIWEHPSPNDFGGGDETFIKSITIREVKS